uniref:Type VI secretion system contractile sheath small subunit n=1 Tax=Eiseniibacteriota bacterium TaxID=2212470 RepID=A0A832I521_UNCEI
MAKETSVAPKERVNIVYKPATGDQQAEVELPLKLFVMGDFTQRPDDRLLEDRKPVRIDKDNFNDVMREHNLSLSFNVKNTLSGQDGDELPVHLKIQTMQDFSPQAVARQVPELQQLVELRNALKALKGPLANAAEFRKRVEALVKDPAKRDAVMKELGLG